MLSHGSSGNRLITMLQAELPGPHALLLHEQTRAPARNWVTAGPVIYKPGITGQRTPPDVGTHANSVSSLVPCFLEQHAYAHPFVSPVLLGHRNCMCPGISRRIRAERTVHISWSGECRATHHAQPDNLVNLQLKWPSDNPYRMAQRCTKFCNRNMDTWD